MMLCCFASCLGPEPLWTNDEKAKFWNVVELYCRQLIEGNLPLPPSTLELSLFKRESRQHREICCALIHDYLWSGKYSLAASNFKAMKAYFQEQISEYQWEMTVELELEEMKEIFMKKPAATKTSNSRCWTQNVSHDAKVSVWTLGRFIKRIRSKRG